MVQRVHTTVRVALTKKAMNEKRVGFCMGNGVRFVRFCQGRAGCEL